MIIGFPDRYPLSKDDRERIKDFALHRTGEVMDKIRERFDFYYAALNNVSVGNQTSET